MPIYLVTDRITGVETMVEAGRPQNALAALIANRFGVSAGLDAGEALRHMRAGVVFIEAVAAPEAEQASDTGETPQPTPSTAELTVTGWDDGDDETNPFQRRSSDPLDEFDPAYAEVDE